MGKNVKTWLKYRPDLKPTRYTPYLDHSGELLKKMIDLRVYYNVYFRLYCSISAAEQLLPSKFGYLVH